MTHGATIARPVRVAVTGTLLAGLLAAAAANGAAAAQPAEPAKSALSGGASTPTGAVRAAATVSATDQRIQDKLASRSTDWRLGPDLAGDVTDAQSGKVIWGHGRTVLQVPASNAKLVTAANALAVFGPDHRFVTRTVKGHYWRNVYLVGGGDPSLSRRDLGRLARSTATAVKAHGRHHVRVFVDDSLFPAPTLAYGWKSTYEIEDVSPVRALVVARHRRWDTSIDAGKVFAGQLAAYGVHVRSVSRRTRPARRVEIARTHGAALSSMLGWMLRESDNDYAEHLHRLVAVGTGRRAGWHAAGLAQRAVLSASGVDLGTSTLYDGSGLSRQDRIAPSKIVAVLSLVFDGLHPDIATLADGKLAIAGRTGTLAPDYLRYVTAPTDCAAGRIDAKTGSLTGVIALSGFTTGTDGRVKLFSFLLNRAEASLRTRRAVDRLASTVTGCW